MWLWLMASLKQAWLCVGGRLSTSRASAHLALAAEHLLAEVPTARKGWSETAAPGGDRIHRRRSHP